MKMLAVVQSVTEELDRGVTTIELGPPEHLSPQDFVNQLMFNRRTTPPVPPPINTTKPPKDPESEDNPDVGKNPGTVNNYYTTVNGAPFSARPITVCNDGAEETIMVLTPGSIVT